MSYYFLPHSVFSQDFMYKSMTNTLWLMCRNTHFSIWKLICPKSPITEVSGQLPTHHVVRSHQSQQCNLKTIILMILSAMIWCLYYYCLMLYFVRLASHKLFPSFSEYITNYYSAGSHVIMFSEKSKWTDEDTAMTSLTPFYFSLTLSQVFTTSFWSCSKFLDYFLEDWHQLCYHNFLHLVFKHDSGRLNWLKATIWPSHSFMMYFQLKLWKLFTFVISNHIFFRDHEFWLKAEFSIN
jgi:hypothetical protein